MSRLSLFGKFSKFNGSIEDDAVDVFGNLGEILLFGGVLY